jgi:soluble cytochrome b562
MAFTDKGPLPRGAKYLVCDNARCNHKCAVHNIRYDEAERTILANCQGLKPEQVLPDPDEQTKQIQSLRLNLHGLTGSLETIEPQINILVDRVSQTTSESLMTRYEAKIGELEEQKAQLTEQKKQIEQDLKQLQSTQKSFTNWKKGLKTLLKSLDDIEIRLKLRLHLKELIDRIDVYPVGFTQRYDRSKDTSLNPSDKDPESRPDPVTIPESFVNTEITGSLLREAMIEVVTEEGPEGMRIEDLDAMVDYVESQCMSKRGRFYRVFFHSGSWIDLVPEGSLARGWKLVKGEWEPVEVDFKPLMAEFIKSRQRSPVGS